jgi:dTDP-glucose 4,6-dehydratase
MKKVLVTGGCGFIGSNFIRLVIDKGYFIVNLDLLTYAGNPANLKGLEKKRNYKFIKGDIGDSKLVERIMRKYDIDTIINFAAESHVDRSILGPEVFTRTNILGTQVLLDVSRKYWSSKKEGYKGKRFLQVSTDEVYGSLGSSGKFKETTPLAPNSPYSASKASADMLVRAYFHTFKYPSLTTRCSNNYGPYQFPEKLIPLMIINALKDKLLPVYGDGKNVRDWLYVDDHCRAIERVARKGKPGEVYNIGGNNEEFNINIVKTVLKVLGKPETLINHVTDRAGHDKRYAIDASKIKKELGWEPKYKFNIAIVRTIRWYLDNQTWWEKIISGEYQKYYKRMYKGK